MDIKSYMDMPYNQIVRPVHDESGAYYHAVVLEFDGCQSTGNTPAEALDGLREAMELWLEAKIEAGQPIPKPVDNDQYSGKFVVRLPKSLHARLAIEAEREGVSLNQYTLYKLSV